MALRKTIQNGYTYYELHISCPVCKSKGEHTPQTYWTHHGCGGVIFMGENAYYLCENCNRETHVKNWKYGCPNPNHGSGSESGYEFIGTTSGELASVVAVAGQMVTQAGVAWLQAFLANMGEF